MLYSEVDNQLFEGGTKLPLVEDFYTIQGEGYHSGKPAYFIRLGGCDVGCEWCDSKYSWNPAIHPLTGINEIISRAASFPAKAVVVTGGEPLLYNLGPLTEGLKSHGIQLFLETSGAYPVSGSWDWICLSPKKTSPPQKELFPLANELKVIIRDKDDLTWAEENASKVGKHCYLYLQPEWGNYNRIIKEIVEYAKNNPRWNISLQSHKFMHIP